MSIKCFYLLAWQVHERPKFYWDNWLIPGPDAERINNVYASEIIILFLYDNSFTCIFLRIYWISAVGKKYPTVRQLELIHDYK